jgi:PAS domain S-box-containing protein
MSLSAVQLNLNELFNVMVDAVIAFDRDQNILYFNRGAEDIFGYTAGEVMGKPLIMLLPARYADIHFSHFDRFLKSPVASRPMGDRSPIYGVDKHGREFPAEAAIAKIKRGDEMLAVVIMRDVTQRKRVEEDLRTQAEQIAVANERSRLARDLHDAVTQTLFSASVIADVLPRIWERNPVEGKKRLEELRQLNRGALAEMRTLLLELRPTALLEANLSDLLKQLAASISSRARVHVALQIDGSIELEPEVKVSLYRIAQEALNNVAKHSGASEATVEVTAPAPKGTNGKPPKTFVQLTITDNGNGFDTSISKPTHLGLDIMRERAAAIEAQLDIHSQIGKGTTVAVTVPY